MKKDIIIPIVKNIQVVATQEWDEDFLAKTWIVYLINNREDIIESVLVMSRGTSKNKKTSTLRHGLGNLLPHTGAKVELVCEEVLGFTNEYLVTFFAEGKLFDIWRYCPGSSWFPHSRLAGCVEFPVTI